ncbi:hypothetical protein BDN70DRAFT_928233 [Pholiota conissans]|uniref:Uncharacterized protein n=1 Tax=Pholiota conissans TaxID=109636 RepID=A0A9P5ZEQ8_9AGAR|nr:hypothetical protein BDN70DRAFT_928233 [Pholiota conissans]
MYRPRAEEWGISPFVIRERDGYGMPWITPENFQAMSLDLKRDYAELYRVPNAQILQEEHIDTLFCLYNRKLPQLPLHELRDDGERCLSRREGWHDIHKQLFGNFRTANEDVPWLPAKPTHFLERLVPAEDRYDLDPSRTNSSSNLAEPPTPVGSQLSNTLLKLVYPPEPPVIGKHPVTGEDLKGPLPHDWLQQMVAEQEMLHEDLQGGLEMAQTLVQQVATEVLLLQGLQQREHAEYQRLLDVLRSICGEPVCQEIAKMADFGETNGYVKARDDDNPRSFEEIQKPEAPRLPEMKLYDEYAEAISKRKRDEEDSRRQCVVSDSTPSYIIPYGERLVVDIRTGCISEKIPDSQAGERRPGIEGK